VIVREAPPRPPSRGEAPPYPAEKARGGEIILRSPLRRVIFIAGLVGVFALALIMRHFL
jgi:hypothetical protein